MFVYILFRAWIGEYCHSGYDDKYGGNSVCCYSVIFEGFHWNDTLEDFEREIWKVMGDNSDNK